MRIDLNGSSGSQQSAESSRSTLHGGALAASQLDSRQGEDLAQLSGAHVQAAALAAQALQLPEVRQERVQSLQLAIQKGQYQLQPKEIGRAVFAHMIAGAA